MSVAAPARPGGVAGTAGDRVGSSRAGGAPTAGDPPAVGWAKRVGTGLLVAAAIFCAVLPAAGAYSDRTAWVLAAVASLASAAVSLLAAEILAVGPLGSYSLSAAGLVVLLLAVAGPHPASIASGVLRAPNRMLTETLPLSGRGAALSGLAVLAWVAGAATSELLFRRGGGGGEAGGQGSTGLPAGSGPAGGGLRGQPGRRQRSSSLVALAVPVLVYLATYAAASSAPAQYPIAGPALLVVLAALAALWVAGGTRAAGRPDAAAVSRFGETARGRALGAGRYRPVVVTATLAVLAVGAGSVVAELVPGLGSGPARLQRRPPVVVPVLTDPVAVMAEMRDADPSGPPTKEMTVTTSQRSDGYMAMAYLNSYDGARWNFQSTFYPTGGRVPSSQSRSSGTFDRVDVLQRVALDRALPLPLLPALDRPVKVSGRAVLAGLTSGMILSGSGSSTTPYSVTSDDIPAVLENVESLDSTASVSEYPADGAIPADTRSDLATATRYVATLTSTRPAASVAFLQAMAQVLRSDEKMVVPVSSPATSHAAAAPSGLSGTTLSEVINAVTVDRAATPEQFATFYAMVARYLGVPVRLVTGFRLSGQVGTGSLPAGRYQVTNRDAWTWDEVAIAGLGWVVVDPTPGATTTATTPPPEQVSAPATTVAPRRADAMPRNGVTGAHALAPSRRQGARSAGVPAWAVPVAATGAVLLLLALAGPGQAAVRRYLRRRRRRGGDPPDLAVGAWLELLDGLSRAGMETSLAATGTEVTVELGRHFGVVHTPPAQQVAALAERALFHPSQPLEPDDVEAAWSTQEELVKDILGGLDRRQRFRALLLVGGATAGPRS